MALFDNDGNIRVTVADGDSRGRYAPDGSWYVNVDSGNKGLYGANGCLNVKTWNGEYTLYNPDGGLYIRDGILVLGDKINEGSGSFDIVTNGTFDTDLTGWVDQDMGTGVSSWETGQLKLVGSDATTNRAGRSQALTTIIGHKYVASADVSIVGSGTVGMLIGNAAMATEHGAVFTSITGTTELTREFTATHTTTYISFRNGGATATEAFVDNVSVMHI